MNYTDPNLYKQTIDKASGRNLGYINPDIIWQYSANCDDLTTKTFIYDGIMHYAEGPRSTHRDICRASRATMPHLTGRVGTFYEYRIASFWNDKPKRYEVLLQDCLNKLLEDGIIDNNTMISTPLLGTIPLSEIYHQQPKAMNHEEQIKLQAAKELHRQAGTESADQLKKELLGGAIKHDDYITKWQNIASESFEEKLTAVLESLIC